MNIKFFVMMSIGALVLAVFVLSMADISIVAIWDNFISGFEFTDYSNDSAYERQRQFYALLNGWMENPIIGAGHGASAAVIRSQEMPWAYELGYMALLFQTGILGILIYGGAVVWIFIRGVGIVRKQPETAGMLIPLLTGLVCFLIANATNPYLQKFDYLWVLFLPIAVLNALLRSKQGVRSL